MMYNLRFKETERGFTLLEVLVSLSIIVVVGVVIGSIIIDTLRGSTKASVLSDVKQNGDYALSEMSRVIRSASSITTPTLPCGNPSPAVSSITVVQLDNSTTNFDCSSGTTIMESQNGGPATSLLDTNTTVLSSCMIVCRQETSADVPTIQIQFTLKQKNANFSEQTATIPFQTTVSLRNIQ